jgi:hypothetical protein
MSLGTVKIPTLAQLAEVAAELGLSFSEADLAAHLAHRIHDGAGFGVAEVA